MGHSHFHLELDEHASSDDIQIVLRGLEQFNLGFAPPIGYRPLNIFLRNDANQILGGLLGETAWEWLHIDIVWIDGSARGQGYGTRLITEAEQEARRRGCHSVHLDTMSFQALPFYERLGYTLWGTLDDHPTGHQRHFLRKKL